MFALGNEWKKVKIGLFGGLIAYFRFYESFIVYGNILYTSDCPKYII